MLIVEDDGIVRAVCAEVAASSGCHVRTADSVPAARALLQQPVIDVVFLDMRLPGGAGITLLEEVRAAHPRAFIVVMTAYATVNSAVEVMRSGAADFLSKPFALDQVSALLERAAERRHWTETSRTLGDRLLAGIGAGRLIAQSPAMQKLLRIVSKVAFARHPVIVSGEHGSGKEVVARAIHANGPNAMHPFIAVDCDSLEPARLEEELLGGQRGDTFKAGLLASAGEGTVYLAEVGALSASVQARLLRALQERRIRSGPAGESVPLTARLLASTSRDLEALVDTGAFRKDLFYKLNVVNLRVPPLRERPEDIVPLAEQFLERQRRERAMPYVLSTGALTSMLDYPWAGNVQELESLIERACALASGPLVHFEDLSSPLRAFAVAATVAQPEEPTSSRGADTFRTLEELERQAIQQTLEQLKGDKILAAKCLGIGKTTLYRKLKEYGLGHDVA